MWEVSVQTLFPLSKVLPEAPSLQSVTEALECQVVLSDVQVFDEEDLFPWGLWKILADFASGPAQHDFQDPTVLD